MARIEGEVGGVARGKRRVVARRRGKVVGVARH